MRTNFDEQLALLDRRLVEMCASCEEVIALAAKAVTDGDVKLAEKVVPEGEKIDRLEREIETLCLRLLLHQQPVAGDLRHISSALKMITDLERIGDQAEDIAGIAVFLSGRTCSECGYIAAEAAAAVKLVTDGITAYIDRDAKLARQVIERDDEVDEYFARAKDSLIGLIAQNPNDGEYALDLLMVAKYFERIGDHATNIAEWAEFAVTGIHVSGN